MSIGDLSLIQPDDDLLTRQLAEYSADCGVECLTVHHSLAIALEAGIVSKLRLL